MLSSTARRERATKGESAFDPRKESLSGLSPILQYSRPGFPLRLAVDAPALHTLTSRTAATWGWSCSEGLIKKNARGRGVYRAR